jgi:hypothetical protein
MYKSTFKTNRSKERYRIRKKNKKIKKRGDTINVADDKQSTLRKR